jgi:hypothetical protein
LNCLELFSLTRTRPPFEGSASKCFDFLLHFFKSLSCLLWSIILVGPDAAMFLVHNTGLTALRVPKSSPQMKQKPWFERFTGLGQNKNVPLGQNLEAKNHYEDTEGDLEAVHFRGKHP